MRSFLPFLSDQGPAKSAKKTAGIAQRNITGTPNICKLEQPKGAQYYLNDSTAGLQYGSILLDFNLFLLEKIRMLFMTSWKHKIGALSPIVFFSLCLLFEHFRATSNKKIVCNPKIYNNICTFCCLQAMLDSLQIIPLMPNAHVTPHLSPLYVYSGFTI